MTNIIYFKIAKLIRDKIPNILAKENIQTNSVFLEKEQYITSLKNKLIEEAEEVSQAKTIDKIQEELGDVLEVMRALMKEYNIDFEDIISLTEKKNIEKGSFNKRIFCSDIGLHPEHEKIKFYRSKPDKYPEIKK